MTSIEPTTSLADLVNARPDFAPTFESLELDYCCGGGRSLAEACFAAGLTVDEVLDQLGEQAMTDPVDWVSMSVPELVDHLESSHHVYLTDALARLSTLMDRVLEAHGENHPELIEVSVALRDLRADLEPHLMKEEQILFPMIRQLYAADETPTFHCGTLQNPIGVMEIEHDRAGALLARLRTLTSAYAPPSDACASYEALYLGLAELEADTHLHIHKENNVLFPGVAAEEMRRSGSA